MGIYKKCISKKSALKIESTTITLTNWSKQKRLKTKNISIDQKNYKHLTIYFTRYVKSKSIKMLNLHYYELLGKIEEYEGKKTLIIDDYLLDKSLDKKD